MASERDEAYEAAKLKFCSSEYDWGSDEAVRAAVDAAAPYLLAEGRRQAAEAIRATLVAGQMPPFLVAGAKPSTANSGSPGSGTNSARSGSETGCLITPCTATGAGNELARRRRGRGGPDLGDGGAVSDILELIDGAVLDYELSKDAMRWAPKPDVDEPEWKCDPELAALQARARDDLSGLFERFRRNVRAADQEARARMRAVDA